MGRKNTTEPDDQQWVIFPPAPISKEPLAPVYAQSDPAWGDVIDWVVYATIIADEKGITAANVDAMAADPPDAESQRLLGGEGRVADWDGVGSRCLPSSDPPGRKLRTRSSNVTSCRSG